MAAKPARTSTARINQKPLTPDALLHQVRMMMNAGETTSRADISRIEKLAEEVERQGKLAQAHIIAAMGNHPLPVRFFSPWASYARINQAERDGTLTTLVRRNAKVLIRASDFFDWFETIPADVKRKKAGGIAREGGK